MCEEAKAQTLLSTRLVASTSPHSSMVFRRVLLFQEGYGETMRTFRSLLFWILTILCCLPVSVPGQSASFDFKRYLFGNPSTLSLWLASLDAATGVARISGVDAQGPTTPFKWMWGDGSVSNGFFPQSHTYADKNKNYVVKVVSTYSGGGQDSAEILVRFVPPAVVPIALSPVIAVHVPNSSISLGTRLYDPPTNLTAFDTSFFLIFPRSTLEYILSVAATVQRDFVNDTIYLYKAAFEQYMLRDSTCGGAYSLWFTDPISFGVGDAFMRGEIDYSSLFHEMGHNFTLNTPAGYYYGGRIDGDANAIYSESMAQIFQHATGYEVVNDYQTFGFSDDLMFDIKQQAIRTVKGLRASYDDYVNAGKPYTSWNDPSTPPDETFGTFMAIAYKFCEHAENAGGGYRVPLKRMTKLLQGFCLDWAQRYDRLHNTAAADTFRSTLMVAALSYAFSTDVREEFRRLNFPISDQLYNELYNSPTGVNNEGISAPLESTLYTCFPNPFNPSTTNRYALPERSHVQLTVFNTLGQQVATLVEGGVDAGYHEVKFDASELASGVYLYRMQVRPLDSAIGRDSKSGAGEFVRTRRLVLLQ